MDNRNMYNCRVCGLISDELPWGEDEKTPSFDICNCCGVEFGYEDSLLQGIKVYRKYWLSSGGEWNQLNEKPIEWDLNEQLKNIHTDFL